jgi:hypothetical protein
LKQKLENGFLQIPKEILTLTKINNKPFSFAEKVVYSYLLGWSKSKGKVFPSMKKMCLDLGIGSRTSMIKYLNKLEDAALLRITKVKGRSSTYEVLSLDGKILCKPKKDSLIRGTNEEKVIVSKEVHDTLPKPAPEPFPLYEDEDFDLDTLPF